MPFAYWADVRVLIKTNTGSTKLSERSFMDHEQNEVGDQKVALTASRRHTFFDALFKLIDIAHSALSFGFCAGI